MNLSKSESLGDIKSDKSLTPFERLQAAKARIQMQQQGISNQKVMAAQDTTSFINKYAQGNTFETNIFKSYFSLF